MNRIMQLESRLMDQIQKLFQDDLIDCAEFDQAIAEMQRRLIEALNSPSEEQRKGMWRAIATVLMHVDTDLYLPDLPSVAFCAYAACDPLCQTITRGRAKGPPTPNAAASLSPLAAGREMPNGQPAQLANLKPFESGNKVYEKASRRSNDTEKAIKAFRKLTPEAADYAGRVLRDETESTGYRLKAMEAILKYGMPRKLEEILAKSLGEGTRAFMRVEFIRPGDDAKDLDAEPNGQGGTFEVSFGDGKGD